MSNSLKTNFLNFFRNAFKNNYFESFLRDTSGKLNVNSFRGKLVPNNYQYPKGSIRKFKYNNIWLEVDIHDYVGHYLYFGFEDKGHLELMSLVKPGYKILDIGTNIGSTLLQMASLTGDEGFVFGFEPDAENFKNCMNNLNLNAYKNIRVDNIGLGIEAGKFNLGIDCESNRGGNRIVSEKSDNTTSISIERLDDWVDKNNVNEIHLVKIDVEGYEINVLKGGINFLTKAKPILFIELDDNNLKLQNSSAQELVVWLAKLGYEFSNAQTNEKVTQDSDFSNCHFDIICKIN